MSRITKEYITTVYKPELEVRNFKVLIEADGETRWFIGCYPKDDNHKAGFMLLMFRRILDDLQRGKLPR